MSFLQNNKFIFWNFIALIFIKAVFSYSGFQIASLLGVTPAFSKEDVITQTNRLRDISGSLPLRENQTLSAAASQKLKDMAEREYFAHFSPDGISPWYWIEKNKYNYTYAGENLAIGFLNASDTVNAWSKSPSHRTNLLNENYTEIGVAVAPVRIKGEEGILVVQMFATPTPAAKPITAVKKQPSKPLNVSAKTPKKLTIPSPTPVSLKAVYDEEALKKNFQIAATPANLNISAAGPQIQKTMRILNGGFILYSVVVFLAMIAVLVLREATKPIVVRTAFSLALVVLAVIIPVAEFSRLAIIF